MQLEKLQDQKPECHLEWPNRKLLGRYNLLTRTVQVVLQKGSGTLF